MEVKHFSAEFTTNRLQLRKFCMKDAQALSDLLRHRDVAATTLKLPFPCDFEKSKELITSYEREQENRSVMRWAIVEREISRLIGGIKLTPTVSFNSAELGFWLGKDYWRKGYTHEAAQKILQFAFDDLQLNRINAHAMSENAASHHLLEKLGFQREGFHTDLIIKWGKYEDVITFGLLKKHYLNGDQ